MTAHCPQNARERWGLLLIDETPDRLIAYPLITGRAAASAGVTLGRACADGAVMARAQLAALEEFGADGISLFSDVGLLAEGMGSRLRHGEHEVPSLDVPVLGAGDDPAQLRPPSATAGRLAEIVRAAEICHRAAGDVVPVFAFVPGPFTTAAMLTGLEEFLTDLVLDPKRAEGILGAAARAAIPFFDALMVAGALPVIVEPLASGSVISEETFRRFALPPIGRQVAYLHRFDMDVLLHVCGQTCGEMQALGDTGADLLSLDRVDLAAASAAVGDRCRILGDVDPALLLHGTPAEVGDAVARAVAAGRGNPKGFVVSTGCEVPPATPAQNLHAFVRTVRELGGGR